LEIILTYKIATYM